MPIPGRVPSRPSCGRREGSTDSYGPLTSYDFPRLIELSCLNHLPPQRRHPSRAALNSSEVLDLSTLRSVSFSLGVHWITLGGAANPGNALPAPWLSASIMSTSARRP